MKSDIDIIKSCLKGNQLAYKQLYEKYISYCYGICTRYSVDKSDLKDLVQVIFTQVFHSLKNYDAEKASFKTWLTRICINHILSFRKKQMRRIQIKDVESTEELNKHYYENNIEERIDREYVLSLIKEMPANYQVVFNLFIIDGYSHEEISQQLEISVPSSRVILNRARKWVKKTLENKLISQNERA